MAVICKCKLSPPPCSVSQVPVLTSLGLGRCAGISLRPRLLVPHIVHRVLFIAASSHTATKNGRLRAFPPDIGSVPAPLWNDPNVMRRMRGKQSSATSSVPVPKKARIVKSHEESVVNVCWTATEQKRLDACTHWRDKHRLQKLILHNRSAVSQVKHFILPFQCGEPARCTICSRSRFLLEKCGGDADTDTPAGSQRVSVQLEKRVQLVNDFNTMRAELHHRIGVPTSLDDDLACTLCGYVESSGWRRLSFFRKRTCPLAR